MSVVQPCVVSLLAPVMSSTCNSVVGAPVRLLAAGRCSGGKQVVGVSWSTKDVDVPSVGGLSLLGIEAASVGKYVLCTPVSQLRVV